MISLFFPIILKGQMQSNRYSLLEFTTNFPASRFQALCLKPFYPQFLIGRQVAIVNETVCCLRCLLSCWLHPQENDQYELESEPIRLKFYT